MIVSHKYKFIFIKTQKTAGTSIEIFFSQYCGDTDVLTPIHPPVEPHFAQNHTGVWNPMPEIKQNHGRGFWRTMEQLLKRRKFFNHIPARLVKCRISDETWRNYFKFCIERNPWDKTLSHYHMIRDRVGGNLSFDDYLERGNFSINHPLYTDAGGRIMVDQVIKYRSLTNGLRQVFDRLGIPFDGSLGVKAKSEHRKDRRPYQELFDERQKTLVAEAFSKEIALHDYTF